MTDSTLLHLAKEERLQKLHSYNILDTPYEKEFDNISALAATICQAPYAVITIADENRLWFKSIFGMEAKQVPLTNSICGNTLQFDKNLLIIDNMKEFEGTKNNDLVTQAPHCVFYAGTKVFNHELVFGTLCIMDTKERTLSKDQLEALSILGQQISQLYNLRKKESDLIKNQKLLETKIEDLDRKTLLLEEVSRKSASFLYLKNIELSEIVYSSGSLLNYIESDLSHLKCTHGIDSGLLIKEDEERLIHYFDELKLTPISNSKFFEFRIKDSGEQIKWFMSIDTPIEKDENGLTTQVAGLITEITEYKTHQKELEQKSKELEEFAYITSHDLLGPIQNLQVFIELLIEKNSTKFDNESLDFARFIRDAASRMNNQIKELLDYAVLGKNREKTSVAPIELVHTVFSDHWHNIPDWEEHVLLENFPKHIDVFATEFKLLIQNLTQNAIKFAHPERTLKITISYKSMEGFHKFSFKDNGIGIKKEFIEQIFRIFNQLDKSKEGMGMGLAQCKKIVQLHGGKIWATVNENCGSTFHFTLRKSIKSVCMESKKEDCFQTS